jgi:hypothetical protein
MRNGSLRRLLIHEDDILMTDPKQKPEAKAAEAAKKSAAEKTRTGNGDQPPGETIEGEGSPGLSILGGGGHA